jgi:hypothetical protein
MTLATESLPYPCHVDINLKECSNNVLKWSKVPGIIERKNFRITFPTY